MTAPRLINVQPVTQKGDLPSVELLKLVEQLARKIDELEARIAALEP